MKRGVRKVWERQRCIKVRKVKSGEMEEEMVNKIKERQSGMKVRFREESSVGEKERKIKKERTEGKGDRKGEIVR